MNTFARKCLKSITYTSYLKNAETNRIPSPDSCGLPSAACRLPPGSAACNNGPKLLSLGMNQQEVPSATRDSGGTRYSDTG